MTGKWTIRPLGECMDKIIDYRGKTPRKRSSGIPLITAKVVKGGRIEKSEEFIAIEDYGQWMCRGLPEAGDILITTEAPLGEVAQLGAGRVALAQRIIALRGKAGVLDNDFLKYLLQSPHVQNQIRARATGTTVLGIKQSELRKVLLTFPPLAEQRAIAHILRTLDDKIELNRRMNETLEQMARAIFKSWFVDFDPVIDNALRAGNPIPGALAQKAARRRELLSRARVEGRDTCFPKHIADLFPDRFVDSELGPIPAGWPLVSLIEIIEINPPRSLAKGQVAPYLDMANMPTNGHAPDNVVLRPFSSGTRFINGDTLMARITPCLENGKTAFVDFLNYKQVGWGSTEYIILRSKHPLPEEFAYLLARTQEFREFAIQSMTGTSGRQRVQPEALSLYRLISPPAPIARIFGVVIKPLFAEARKVLTESKTLAAIRDALLPKLIHGELRVIGLRRERNE